MEANDKARQDAAGAQGGGSGEDALRDAPPGSSTLSSSPPTQGPGDNPVIRSARDVGDALADQVREGSWKTDQEKRDEQREG